MVFVRYRTCNDYNEEFLFCEPLLTTTTGLDVLIKNWYIFFKTNNLNRSNRFGASADGAPAMSGRRIGFCKRVQEINHNVIITHYFLHRENLATQAI